MKTIKIEQVVELLTNLPPGATLEITTTTQSGEVNVKKPTTRAELLQQFSHLAGQGISISQAAEKYNVPRGAIDSWVYRSNYVKFVDETTYPKLIDEAEMAMCAQIYHARKTAGTSGLPYFDGSGCLITEVKRPASTRNVPLLKKAA